MKQIPLTKGKIALVDDEDYEDLSGYTWHAAFVNKHWTARRTQVADSKQSYIYMHRQILGAQKGEEVHHISDNHLDNQRANLKHYSEQELQHTRRKTNPRNTPTVNPEYHPRTGKAGFPVNIYLGTFDAKDDAKEVYKKAATLLLESGFFQPR
jgi:hypothetical protein